jgi:hypothetical protein
MCRFFSRQLVDDVGKNAVSVQKMSLLILVCIPARLYFAHESFFIAPISYAAVSAFAVMAMLAFYASKARNCNLISAYVAVSLFLWFSTMITVFTVLLPAVLVGNPMFDPFFNAHYHSSLLVSLATNFLSVFSSALWGSSLRECWRMRRSLLQRESRYAELPVDAMPKSKSDQVFYVVMPGSQVPMQVLASK